MSESKCLKSSVRIVLMITTMVFSLMVFTVFSLPTRAEGIKSNVLFLNEIERWNGIRACASKKQILELISAINESDFIKYEALFWAYTHQRNKKGEMMCGLVRGRVHVIERLDILPFGEDDWVTVVKFRIANNQELYSWTLRTVLTRKEYRDTMVPKKGIGI